LQIVEVPVEVVIERTKYIEVPVEKVWPYLTESVYEVVLPK